MYPGPQIEGSDGGGLLVLERQSGQLTERWFSQGLSRVMRLKSRGKGRPCGGLP